MRYNRSRRYRHRNNDRGFRRGGSQDIKSNGINGVSNSFQRRTIQRNGQNPSKMLEKYSNLAKEALSNGDKILSENYYQHADHFLRIMENQNVTQNNQKAETENSTNKEISSVKKTIDGDPTNKISDKDKDI